MKSEKSLNRVWELDFFRGIALLLMIYFHIVFDLNEIFGYQISYVSGINYYIGKASVILFIIISGISSSFSRNITKRGIKVLAIALVITLVSHVFGSEFGIKFGVLHFLGVCMILYPVLSKLNRYLLIVLGTVIIISGNLIGGITLNFDYLFPLGLTSSQFKSADYYPLLPWSGLFLYGIALSKLIYAKKISIFDFSIKDNIISKLGKNTLLIYVLHQPIIIAVINLLQMLIK